MRYRTVWLVAAGVLLLGGCASTSSENGAVQSSPPSVSSTPTTPTNFSTVNELVEAVAPLGVACPGKSGDSKQRTCSSSLNMTIWPDHAAAINQAHSNVQILQGPEFHPSYIVIGNGMISGDDDLSATQSLVVKLAPLNPQLIDTPHPRQPSASPPMY